MISFIIPAHNEEAWMGRCLAAIRGAMDDVKTQHEVIVVDDGSTDATSAMAREHGVRVMRVEHRQIAATRNTGARDSRGDILLFVDADTQVNAAIVRSALRTIEEGAVGGGCVPRYEGPLPLWWRLFYPFFAVGARWFQTTGGSCLFCTRGAFEVTGGFSEAHFAGEDMLFIQALKRHGRFVLIDNRVLTSGRNLRAHSFWHIAGLLARLALRGPDAFRDRRGLDLWYRPSRDKVP